MSSHSFLQRLGEDVTIRCNYTGGSFSSSLWRLEKVADRICPCCGYRINKKGDKQ